MPPDAARSFARYLEAKRTVDDRALNVRVWDRMATNLANREPHGPLRVLEVGGGVGTMVERLRYSGMLGRCEYTFLDSDPDLIDAAQIRLNSSAELQIEFVTADALRFLREDGKGRSWDLIVANAVLDLTDLSLLTPALLTALRPDGLLYCSTNYDGLTAFMPVIEPALDAQVELLYNASMHVTQTDGTVRTGSHTGRALIPVLRSAGASIVEAGASDWVVFADETGYHADEGYFLRHILGFVDETLSGHPELDQEAFSDWLRTRQHQILTGELVYIAHQIDVLARRPA